MKDENQKLISTIRSTQRKWNKKTKKILNKKKSKYEHYLKVEARILKLTWKEPMQISRPELSTRVRYYTKSYQAQIDQQSRNSNETTLNQQNFNSYLPNMIKDSET